MGIMVPTTVKFISSTTSMFKLCSLINEEEKMCLIRRFDRLEIVDEIKLTLLEHIP